MNSPTLTPEIRQDKPAHGSMFASLRYPGATRYFIGLTLSMLGSWMQSIALTWLVGHKLHGHGREIGILQVFQFAPMLAFGAWAGSIADRIDKRKLMIVTQVLLGAAALVLAILDFSGRATLLSVYLISGFAGLASAFDTPVRRALIGDLVPKSALPNAMSLNTGVITSARVAGMALGGFITEAFGTGWCFVLNGVSYLAMMVALSGLRRREHRTAPSTEGSGVAEAFRHVWRTPTLRIAMVTVTIVATLTFNYNLTFVLMITDVFHRNAGGLGAMMSITSVGTFIGALNSARQVRPSLHLLLTGSAIMGASACVAALAHTYALCSAAVVPMGFGGGLLMAQLSGLLTSLSPSAMRGRVLALQSVIFIGSTPIGGPLVGAIADRWGARWSVGVGGIAALFAAAVGASLWVQQKSG